MKSTACLLILYLECFIGGISSPSYKDFRKSNSSTGTNEVVTHPVVDYDLPPLSYCQKSAKCLSLNYTTCMGAKLPYSSTTLELTDLTTQEKVQERLHLFQHLRHVPKCWAVIQPFLCALYMPKCEKDKVDLPSTEMCRITLEPCKIFYASSVLPKFFNCDDSRTFKPKCKNDVHELKFNTTGFCMEPLVKTDQQDWFYEGVEGCGLGCKDSLYTEDEHKQIHKLTAYCVLICIIFNSFTIITFIIDWKTANKYPALTIFYINICFLISYSGWAIQFLGSETREDIVCKKDGTLRKSEPSATENLSCVTVFVMVYYFLIAGMVWLVLFSYTWYMNSLQALGKIQDRVDKKRSYFHLIAWSLPLVLTITTMALGEIDGDFVTGICIVGMVNFGARVGLLLFPLAAAMTAAGYIIVRGLILLVKVKNDGRNLSLISESSSKKIRDNIVRIGVFTLLKVLFCIVTFVYHGYVSSNTEIWRKSFRSYIMCKLTSLSSDYSHCKQEARPSVAMLQLQLLAVFGAGMAIASWVWCPATVHSWTRYIRKKFRCEIEEPIKIRKHHIIAQAFEQRHIFNEGGRISIECQHYTDPVGLNFAWDSAVSNNLSTTWAKTLPRFLNRRGAMVDGAYSMSSSEQSVDSEISLNVRQISIESRCNSGDSQLSFQIAELKATRKFNRRRRSRVRRKHDFHQKRNSRDVGGSSRRVSDAGAKRGSSSSLDSHLQFFNALANNCNVKNLQPNLKRRAANAGLDGQHINNLLSKGKLVIPYNVTVKSGSEDENVSVTISESKINMIVSNTNNANNFDLTDQLVMKSLGQGLHIKELTSSSESEEEQLKEHERRRSKSGRDSHQSRRSKRSRRSRKKYDSNSDSFNVDENAQSDSSTCPEIKQLL